MAKVNLGQRFDATNSWNGYNHQGKVALYVALHTINQLIADGKQADIDQYFLETEWVEDFSIGYCANGMDIYQSIHQVKAWEKTNLIDYSSALFGLVENCRKRPSIEHAYLHVVNPINLAGATWQDSLGALITDGAYLKKELTKVEQYIGDAFSQQQIIEDSNKSGRPKSFISALKKHSSTRKLSNSNINQVLADYKADIETCLKEIKNIKQVDLNKITLYPYHTATLKNYCELNSIQCLLKEQITQYLQATDPGGWKQQSHEFIDKMYLYLIGNLDQHLIQRHRDYRRSPERKIQLSKIVEWICSDEPAANGTTFYLYYLKNSLFEFFDERCERCKDRFTKCAICQVPACMYTLGQLSFDELNSFLRATNPDIGGKLDMNTYAKFLQKSNYFSPFFEGLKRIKSSFSEDNIPISFSTPEKALWVLTTLLGDSLDNAKEYCCANIVKNREASDILMDYDVLISRNITSDSIFTDAGDYLRNICYEQDDHHIAHYKNVKIIPLEECIEALNRQLSNTEKV